jgi:hypothetical protein
MLKESEELDSLLNDLLLSMGLIPLDKPQIGARQYGADIRAIGKLKNDTTKTIYLFVIKQGDITRDLWNNTSQSIRPSLDELKDTYMQLMVEKEYIDYPIKIILCTNGEMNQTVQPNWNGYVKNQATSQISYEFWGGNRLSDLINQYLLNEFLFPEQMQKKIRKSLAFIDIDDYDYKHIYELIDEIIKSINIENKKSLNKNVRLLNLIINMIHLWGCENNVK